MEKFCIYCGKKILGRSDKKFCDNQCRNAWHNSNPNRSEIIISDINKILRKNRSILKFISPEGKTTVKKLFLSNLNFNFKYFTNIYNTQNDNIYYLCYDYGYMFLENEKILIVKWKNYS